MQQQQLMGKVESLNLFPVLLHSMSISSKSFSLAFSSSGDLYSSKHKGDDGGGDGDDEHKDWHELEEVKGEKGEFGVLICCSDE